MDDLKKKLQLLKKPEKGAAPAVEIVAEEEEWEEWDNTPFGIGRRLKNPPPPPPVIQDEGDFEFSPFKIGQLSSSHYWGQYTPHDHNDHPNCTDARQALPSARWPEPGKVASPEVKAAYNHECDIVSEADRTLHSLDRNMGSSARRKRAATIFSAMNQNWLASRSKTSFERA